MTAGVALDVSTASATPVSSADPVLGRAMRTRSRSAPLAESARGSMVEPVDEPLHSGRVVEEKPGRMPRGPELR